MAIYTAHFTHPAFDGFAVELDATTERPALATARKKRDCCGKGWCVSVTATGGDRSRVLSAAGRWSSWQ